MNKNSLLRRPQLSKSTLVGRRVKILAFTLLIGAIISSLIPPFQSPDEFDHIKRAYLLSKGQLILESPPNLSSGGQIDNGLLNYMAVFSHLPHESKNTVTREKIDESKKSRWLKTTSFSPAPGTGYYFPLIYFPETLGLLIGESLDFTIDRSYRLTRFLALGFSLAIIGIATLIYPTNFLTLALLTLPITIFQLVSASLDGTTTAIGILCISLFMRAADKTFDYPAWVSWLLPISLLLLVTSRAHLLPLVGMPLAAFFFRRRVLDLLLFLVLATLSLIWLYVALHSTVDLRLERAYTTSHIISYYVKKPLTFVTVIWSTLMNAELRQFYQMSFIGILGWLDLMFERWFYNFSILVCAWMGILSIQWKKIKADWAVRAWLLGFSVTSILLVFFLLLATWTDHPAVTVSGVQGRYFLVSFILLAYSLSGWTTTTSSGKKLAALLPYYLYCLVLSLVMPQALVYRYFAQ
jgi:uncharacterized membrane protein